MGDDERSRDTRSIAERLVSDAPEERAREKDAVAAKARQGADEAGQLSNEPNKALLRWIAKLGAGIASILGLTGFVGLVGSAVMWQRFQEAGLPATQALAAVPEDQRIIQGASDLVVALTLGVLVVGFLFAADRTGQVNAKSRVALLVLWLGAVVFVVFTDLSVDTKIALAILGLVLAGVSVGVGRVTGDQYVPFAVAVFVSTIGFAAVLNYAIAAQENFAQPAAVLRSADGDGIRGLYVADNDDFIYIGVIRSNMVPCEEADEDETVDETVPLYRIPRTEETRLLIGKRQGFCDAVEESETVRSKLKEAVELAPTEGVPSGTSE